VSQLYVISVGGSLIAPEGLDTNFLKSFKSLVLKQVKKGNRFILITGGGRLSRNYQEGLKQTAKPSSQDLDWLGIFSTRLNAQLVRLMFGKMANKNVVEDPNKKIKFTEKILVAGGWMPGRSTDDDAVRLAKIYGSNTIINLSNIDYIYNKDPRKFKDAQKLEKLAWKDYTKMVGKKWSPGGNYAFDPIAALTAAKNKQQVIVAHGKDLGNLKNILEGKKFKGSVLN
jgi:uridylate kinase